MGIEKQISKSLALIELAFKQCDSWYVSFSGGKDSTVMRDLVLRINPDTPVVAYVQKWRLPETTEYLRRIPKLNIVCSRDTKDKEYSDDRWVDENEARGEWPECTWLNTDSVACDINYGRKERGAFIGLRSEESARRRWQIKTYGSLFQRKDGRWQCYPLAHWSVIDIWQYIKSNQLDYNKAYDVMSELRVPIGKQRIAEFQIDAVMGFGAVAILKQGWPDLFNRYKAIKPEVTLYV